MFHVTLEFVIRVMYVLLDAPEFVKIAVVVKGQSITLNSGAAEPGGLGGG